MPLLYYHILRGVSGPYLGVGGAEFAGLRSQHGHDVWVRMDVAGGRVRLRLGRRPFTVTHCGTTGTQ